MARGMQGNVLMNNADGRSPEEAAAAAARAAAIAAGTAEVGDETPAMHLGMIMVGLSTATIPPPLHSTDVRGTRGNRVVARSRHRRRGGREEGPVAQAWRAHEGETARRRIGVVRGPTRRTGLRTHSRARAQVKPQHIVRCEVEESTLLVA
jgi:hypothetical protein